MATSTGTRKRCAQGDTACKGGQGPDREQGWHNTGGRRRAIFGFALPIRVTELSVTASAYRLRTIWVAAVLVTIKLQTITFAIQSHCPAHPVLLPAVASCISQVDDGRKQEDG
jgi:hypothetical protein